MNKFFYLLPFFFVMTSCVPMPITSDMDMCSAKGLSSYHFFTSHPDTGTEILPEKKDQTTIWRAEGNSFYVACHYESGVKRIRRLPLGVTSCESDSDLRLSCTMWM